MNIKNNARYKTSNKKIEDAFLTLIKTHRYEDITIGQICKQAGINRSTFYCHYDDINDFIIKIEKKFAKGMATIFNNGTRRTHAAFVEMFTFVQNNRPFYQTFLNIPYATMAETDTKGAILKDLDTSNVDHAQDIDIFYRASFFGAGIKEMCRLWLARGCQESPEQMAKMLLDEYKNRDH